jgi:hypothetical protein
MRLALSLVVATAVALAAGGPLDAQSLDPASSAALDAVLRLLQDPTQRKAAIERNPEAAAVDQQLQSMLGSPELQQEFYTLAGDIFADVIRDSGGDIGKMAKALEAGRTDPAGFMARLSPQTLERLRALSTKVSERTR